MSTNIVNLTAELGLKIELNIAILQTVVYAG